MAEEVLTTEESEIMTDIDKTEVKSIGVLLKQCFKFFFLIQLEVEGVTKTRAGEAPIKQSILQVSESMSSR
jgi:hypothetical protein